MSLSKIRKEQSRATAGAWVNGEVHGLGEDLRFLVRGRWNADFQAMQAKMTASVPRERKIRASTGLLEISPAENDRIILECLLKTVLLGWEGLRETDDSEPIPYTPEKARELLSDPLLAPLRDAVLICSIQVAQEGKEATETDAKN
jgi:hypothetical protein